MKCTRRFFGLLITSAIASLVQRTAPAQQITSIDDQFRRYRLFPTFSNADFAGNVYSIDEKRTWNRIEFRDSSPPLAPYRIESITIDHDITLTVKMSASMLLRHLSVTPADLNDLSVPNQAEGFNVDVTISRPKRDRFRSSEVEEAEGTFVATPISKYQELYNGKEMYLITDVITTRKVTYRIGVNEYARIRPIVEAIHRRNGNVSILEAPTANSVDIQQLFSGPVSVLSQCDKLVTSSKPTIKKREPSANPPPMRAFLKYFTPYQWTCHDEIGLGLLPIEPMDKWGDIFRKLHDALDNGKVTPVKVFGYHDGFAVMTKMEIIHDDGGFGIDRFAADAAYFGGWDAESILRGIRDLAKAGLFGNRDVYFRTFVFIFTRQAGIQIERPQPPKLQDLLVDPGESSLPDQLINNVQHGDEHLHVIVYEFHLHNKDEVELVKEMASPKPKFHVAAARIWPKNRLGI
jgi:hypothetical protein